MSREVPSNLLTAGGLKNKSAERTFSRGRNSGYQSHRATSVPTSSRGRSTTASPNMMMGAKPSISRSKSLSRKSSGPKVVVSSRETKPKMVGHQFDSSSKTLDGLTKSCPKLSSVESPKTKKAMHQLMDSSSRTVDGLNKSCPKLSSSMESPKTMKAVHQIDGLKQGVLALPNSSGGRHGDTDFLKESPSTRKNRHQMIDSRAIEQGLLALPYTPGGKYGDSGFVSESPLNKKDRHQVDSRTVELRQVHSNNPSPGGKHGDSGFGKKSPAMKKDRHQLENRTIDALQQSFQAFHYNPREKQGDPKLSREKERPNNNPSSRKRIDPMFFQEGQSSNRNNVGHPQDSVMGIEVRTQNVVALPNSSARLARRNSSNP